MRRTTTITGRVTTRHFALSPGEWVTTAVAATVSTGAYLGACPQSPDALRQLVEAGHPAAVLAYYRGGMHDWVTLAMPTEPRTD